MFDTVEFIMSNLLNSEKITGKLDRKMWDQAFITDFVSPLLRHTRGH